MANNEKFIFSVDAEISSASQKLKEVARMMDEIEKKAGRIVNRNFEKSLDEYSTTTQKDMDKNMRMLSRYHATYKQLQKDLKDLERVMQDTFDSQYIPDGATDEQVESIKNLEAALKSYRDKAKQYGSNIESSYEAVLWKMQQMAEFQEKSSRNFKHVFTSKDIFNLPKDGEAAKSIMESLAKEADEVTGKLNDIISKTKEVQKLDRRSESLSRRASAANYMSYQQATSFEKDYKTSQTMYKNMESGNFEELVRLGQERSRLSKQVETLASGTKYEKEIMDLRRQIDQIQQNPQLLSHEKRDMRAPLEERLEELENSPLFTQADRDKKVALQGTIDSIDAEMEARMELNRQLQRTIANMRDYNAAVQGVEVKPERGTTMGMIYERAPAIGLSLGTVGGATIAGLFTKGASVNNQMRHDVISIGQRTETPTGEDGKGWREGIRDNAFGLGLNSLREGDKYGLGFTGSEMLALQENYLSNAGFSSMDDLNAAAQAQGMFSRTTGVDLDTTKSFFDAIYSTGAVKGGSQTKDIQDAFIGGIKNSGMEGREKDQISALEGILESVKQGRTMTNADVMNIMGIQSLLASSGNRALSGQQGGQLLTDLNEGIRQGFQNPTARLIFGQGTKYQGLEGRWALRQQVDRGISDIENVNALARFAQAQSGGNENIANEIFASTVQDLFGTDITAEKAKGLMDMFRSGQTTEENIKKILEANKSLGATTAQERYDEYSKSKEAMQENSEAVVEKQTANLYDVADIVHEINNGMKNWNAAAWTLAAAAGAMLATLAVTSLSFPISRGVRKFASRNRYGQNRAPGGPNSRSGGGFGGGVILGPDGKPLPPSGGGTSPTGGGWWSNTKSKVGGWFGKGGGTAPTPPTGGGGGGFFAKVGDWFKGGSGTAAGGGGLKGFLSGAGKVLNKVALPLAAIGGIAHIATAEKGEKGKATGEAVGGIGGGFLGGAGAGALAGSVFGPVGTLIGGLVGGIGGSIAGSKLGGWIGGLFDPDKASAAELEQQTNSTNEQVDRETANTKERAESKKADNLQYERENLHTYELLLDRAERILSTARAQGGIFGNGSGTSNVMNTSAGGGGLNYIAGGGKWTATDLRKHDLASTDPSVTAADLDAWIDSKAPKDSVMRGMGDAFMEAAMQSGLDPRYLVAHAAHETGWGTSRIAKEKGNMFGIGAFDSSPYASAYGYDGARAGIIEGAKWIRDNYYNRGQTTLETMRHNGGTHEYATDPQWDEKIAAIMNGAPQGSGTKNVNVNSTITVKVDANKDVATQVSNSQQWKTVAQQLQNKVYGSMDYYSKEMRTV